MSELELLNQARCAEPFRTLGQFVKDERTVELRVWLPEAMSVVAEYGTKRARVVLEPDGAGLFTGVITTDSAESYQLDVTYTDGQRRVVDPYQFQQEAYHAVHFIDREPANLYRQAGAQVITVDFLGEHLPATRFAVYAPNAMSVSLIGDFNHWDGRVHPMQKTQLGYWVIVMPGVTAGVRYKYEIKDRDGNLLPHKADPVGFFADQYPSHASIVYDHKVFNWTDDAWMRSRNYDKYTHPMSIYEVHLGSWRKPGEADNRRYLTYRELATELVNYVVEMGYTHIECLPVSEYPFDGSWGYQPVGMFAPTSRFGEPDDFKYFVNACHNAGIGVIVDWVPAHFPEDGHGLARFDGSHVYEYADPRRGWHPDWNSCIYDFGKDTVRQFLVASALYWLEHFHIDGLRVDAVASMLYLDYSRNEGEWIPNVDGGNENYEAISLLRWLNQEVYQQFPGAMTIAEESTSFAKVSRPVYDGGLGFGFKWNMGWMHDSLHYISKDPAYRRYHHGDITFSMVYAFDENFVLPISHDEVVHGKGSLLGKMPGDEWQQAANLRCYAGFMYAHPGKKLNFMGNEFAQSREWDHDSSLDWHLLEYDKHRGIQRLYQHLNTLYTSTPALYDSDHHPQGFAWIDHENAGQSIVSFVRRAQSIMQKVYVIANFTPVAYEHFLLGVEDPGQYRVVLNTDANAFWGSDYPLNNTIKASTQPWNNQRCSIALSLPPLATLFVMWE